VATRRRRTFTPYRPPTPPAGSYDPSLDSQEAAARRGLSDLQGQLGTQQARDVTDYALAQQDMLTNYQQQTGDLQLRRNQTQQDFTRGNELRGQRYQVLGRNQLQTANTAGVLRGGALLQAAARRSFNQGQEQQDANTQYGRQIGGIDTAYGRATQDYENRAGKLALDYSPPDANNPLGGRRFQDRTTQLTQAQRELAFFGQDIGNQRTFQAAASGWDPEQRPANEFVSAAGVPYQVRGGIRYDQRGRRLGRATGRGF
jgi:hypothetical protein